MLHFDYQKSGSHIDLPEVAGHAGTKNTRFELLSTHPGGMGVCYHLRSDETGTEYALKCIHPRLLGGADSLNRFRDELEIWLSASACDAVTEAIAIVRINDIPSMLAPWMTGGDLANARASLRPEHKMQVILRVVRGLQWVKEKLGVIHRDLKPSNILLDANGNGSIADWGLARPAKAAMREAVTSQAPQKIERPDRTQQGSFMGTVLYASPEQLIDAASVDHRADIYALGCIMFEMEVGMPPFSGKNSQEIAQKHLYEMPPKLGGFLKKTQMGLEAVIQRCLAKQPSQRYHSYAELEKAVTLVAMGRGFSIHTCRVAERYRRFQLGKGHVAQEHLIEKAAAIGNQIALLEFAQVRPYLEEATNLMALHRFKEAEVILREYYVPDVLNSGPIWHMGHALAESYAHCLQKLEGRLDESISIYSKLSDLADKAPEYYVNFSMAFLHRQEWTDALTVCERGLAHYPNDLDILGNYTIALKSSGNLDAAQETAMRRLSLRRDVHSLEEAASVVRAQRNLIRNSDLPGAIELAKLEYSLIQEALALNPRYPALRITEIQFLRFAGMQIRALEHCRNVMNDEQFNSAYRQLAFAELIEELGLGDDFKAAIDLAEKHLPAMKFGPARERVEFTKWRIYADKWMIGKDTAAGERILIPEVADYFLNQKHGKYPHPITTARVLDWMGRKEEAELLLRATAEHSWEAGRQLSLMLQREHRFKESCEWANYLVETAPWRAESYDVLAYVAAKAGDQSLQTGAKERADQVFATEVSLFEELRCLVK